MDEAHRRRAEALAGQLRSGVTNSGSFREALFEVPSAQRDAWVDCVLRLEEVPDDGPDLPKDCTPYLPCEVEAVLRVIEHAGIGASDTFVDVGAGAGRAAALVHLLTGARAVGVEIQPQLVEAGQALAARLGLGVGALRFVAGDAVTAAPSVSGATHFFLYCPFSGQRLAALLAGLEPLARARRIRICCVNLPLPPCDWLRLEQALEGDVSIYGSRPQTVRVFVYGTLQSGESNHHVLAGARRVCVARTAPRFELRDLGPYPGLVRGGDQSVAGEVYEVSADALSALDEFEEHPDLYCRSSIALEDGTVAEAYLLTPKQAQGLPVIASGDWRRR